MIGVGSLGSGVAELLAKSGVGDISLVDPETMETENASRHLLGCEYAGQRKADGVAGRLQSAFPSSKFSPYVLSAQEFLSKHASIVESSNLILALTGVASCDFEVECMRLGGGVPPVVYGWMEEHCVAAHAVRVGDRPGCLRCVLDPEDGWPVLPVSKWDRDTRESVAACGGMFQPYGAIELAKAQSLVAQVAIETMLNGTSAFRHAVWLGRTSDLNELGGGWNPQWESTHFEIGQGGLEVDLDKGGGCGFCSK
jgi:hypothetical protein